LCKHIVDKTYDIASGMGDRIVSNSKSVLEGPSIKVTDNGDI